MLGRRNRDITDEAAEFGSTLVDFLATLAGLVRHAAQWFGLVGLDAISAGAGVVSEQAETLAGASRAKTKAVRKRGRRGLLKLVAIAVFVWWLDRDLSETRG